MNKLIRNNIIRFVGILLLQVLVFKGVQLSSPSFTYIHVLIYPIIILLLPLEMPKPYLLMIAFGVGLFVDMFYDSIGIHASALVFMAYIRSFILKMIEPRGGYTAYVPGLGNVELAWFASYVSLCMLAFLLFYFSMEAFSFVYIIRILLNTIMSFIISVALIILFEIIFKTKQ